MGHRSRSSILTAVAVTFTLAAPATAEDPFIKRASSAVAVTSDGTILLVANPDSGSLSVVDTRDLMVLGEIAVGDDPRTVVVEDGGRRAYVTNRASGTLSVVDLGGFEEIAEIPVGGRPYGVVVSPDGRRAYVAVQDEDRVVAVDVGLRRIETFVDGLDMSYRLARVITSTAR
jgi:YVTN family beta-propeller protein